MICENEYIAIEDLGSNKLQDRLADLVAATSVRELIVGNPSESEYESLPAYKVDIDAKHVLYFTPNHLKTPCLQDGQVDWDKVSRIKILAIQKN